MKRMVSRFWLFFAAMAICIAVMPQWAEAKPHIDFRFNNVYLNSPGEITIEGYYENIGDQQANPEWSKFDLAVYDEDGNLLWADTDIYYYPEPMALGPGDMQSFTFYIHNDNIPEYHGKYRWKKTNASTHRKRTFG